MQVAVAVARALVHLHAQKPPMIHRDVKSQNVLLTRIDSSGGDMVAAAKLADFGTADTRPATLGAASD